MSKPRLELASKYMTASQVARELNLSRFQLNIRIANGMLPIPTITHLGKCRYFDAHWLKVAKASLQ